MLSDLGAAQPKRIVPFGHDTCLVKIEHGIARSFFASLDRIFEC
jgi:hypothetical protein